jgi:serine/threonine protein kinase
MSQPTGPVPVPAILQGRYRIGPVLGRGGASVVYQARDTLLGRDVAIKVFTTRAVRPEDLHAQEGEARLLGSLNHPALVTLLDAGVDLTDVTAPQVFLVMELVLGADLRQRLRQGALDALAVMYLGWDLLGALSHVHELGIIHRDIKPANVLLVDSRDRPPRGKLADFGIAMLRAQNSPVAEEYTTGTAAYLSPEQVEGLDLSPATDVYSLGLVLLEAFTARPAFPGDVLDSALARLDHDPAIPDEMPPALAGLLGRMTARSAADRPTAEDAMLSLRRMIIEEMGGQRPQARDPEAERLEAVRRYNLLDTPPDGAFDRITALAARLFDVPVAIVSLVDEDRIFLKSHHGLDVNQVERRRGFSTMGGLHQETLVIEDTARDARIVGNPALAGTNGLRFYAGVPLITPDGHNLGALAVVDWIPHSMPPGAVATLEDLAALVLHEMELRRAARRIVTGHE